MLALKRPLMRDVIAPGINKKRQSWSFRYGAARLGRYTVKSEVSHRTLCLDFEHGLVRVKSEWSQRVTE